MYHVVPVRLRLIHLHVTNLWKHPKRAIRQGHPIPALEHCALCHRLMLPLPMMLLLKPCGFLWIVQRITKVVKLLYDEVAEVCSAKLLLRIAELVVDILTLVLRLGPCWGIWLALVKAIVELGFFDLLALRLFIVLLLVFALYYYRLPLLLGSFFAFRSKIRNSVFQFGRGLRLTVLLVYLLVPCVVVLLVFSFLS